MAEETTEAPSPALSPGQTTSAGENTQSLQEQPAEEPAAPGGSSIWDNWLLYAVILFWVWWLFGNKKRKAQKEREKKEKARRESLQKGDGVVTIGRLHGRVVAFTDLTVTIQPDDSHGNLNLVFDRQGIFRVLPRPGEEAETEKAAEDK
ncbi:MAG: preprotein translocase subunit YajC [Planctomycetota bacterium]|jgi:preprotein translocase subunit YajC|nr:preprotein translocase subunit YajC [Planctomycetota bacterium]